jgi:WD40 repeat protein
MLAGSHYADRVIGLYDLATHQPRFPAAGHARGVVRLAFSPDGRLLASPSDDRTVKLWDVTSGKETATLTGHDAEARAAAFSPDGKLLATAGGDGTVRLWDAISGRHLHTLTGHAAAVEAVAFSPDGKWLASGGLDKTVRLWNVASAGEQSCLRGHDGTVWAVAFSPDGRSLASASEDRTVRVWDVAGGTRQHLLEHPQAALSVAFLPDRPLLASGGRDGEVRLWSLADGTLQQTLPGPGGDASALAVRPDGRLLAAVGFDGAVRLWDLDGDTPRQRTWRLFPYGHWIAGVAFSPDGRHLATGNPDGTVYLLRLGPPGQATLPGLPTPDPVMADVRSFTGHTRGIAWVAFSRDGTRAFSAGWDGTARIWDVATGKELHRLDHPAMSLRVAVTPDDRFLLTTCNDRQVRVWDVQTGREVRRLEARSHVWALALAPDGGLVATVPAEGSIVVVSDGATGKELRRLPVGYPLAFTAHGKSLICASEGRLWLADAETGAVVRQFAGHRDWIRDGAMSPDGRHVVSVGGYSGGAGAGGLGADCSVRLWDLETGQELWRRQENGYTRWGVAFSPDGRRVVAGSYDRTVRVYDAATGDEVACANTPAGVFGVAVAPDGRHVLAGGRDGVLRMYRLPDPPAK